MSTTFTRINNKVLVTKGNEQYLIDAAAHIRTEDRMPGKLIISGVIDGESDSGVIIDTGDITGITFASVTDLLTQLATNFFFRVNGSGGSSTAPFAKYSAVGVQDQTNFIIPQKIKPDGLYYAVVNQLVIMPGEGLTITNGVDNSTATFATAPDEGAKITFVYNLYSSTSAAKKIYRVLLNQTGTANAVATVLEDSVTGVVITRSGVGTSLFTKVGAFVVGKALPSTLIDYTDAATGNRLVLTPVSADVYKLETYAAANTAVLADGVLTNQELNIEIYI